MININISDITAAYARIRPYVRETDLVYSAPASKLNGGEVYLKMETQQEIGAYKIRGAMNNMLTMSKEDLARGVVAASAGNHSQAVARAAYLSGTSAIVCVPESTPMNKREGALKWGGQLEVFGPGYMEAEARAYEIARETGRKFVHAYETPETIAGAGTVAIEAILQGGKFDVILVPTGGGGLLDGVCIAAKALIPDVKVYGLQTVTSAPWDKSFHERMLNNDCAFERTVADGLEGEISWPNVELAIAAGVDDILVVSERETRHGIKWMAENHHEMVEGASATCIAALLEMRPELKGKKVLCIITGKNIDLSRFHEVCSEDYI